MTVIIAAIVILKGVEWGKIRKNKPKEVEIGKIEPEIQEEEMTPLKGGRQKMMAQVQTSYTDKCRNEGNTHDVHQ